MELDTKSRSSLLMKLWHDKRPSPTFYRIAILKNFKRHKNVMESLSKIKTCKSLKEVMVSFFNVKL